MESVTATPKPATILHVRGTWSARDDRTASAVWLGLLWLGMIAGFGLDMSRYLHENPVPPMVLHLHAAVFSIWMLLLTAQVLLVLRGRVAWHRRLGWFAAGWACLMAVMGPWAAMVSQVRIMNTPYESSQFLSVNLLDIAGFLGLLTWGMALRRNPAAHRRMMILATISPADPGFSRFSSYLWPTEPHSVLLWFLYSFYGNVLLIVLMAAGTGGGGGSCGRLWWERRGYWRWSGLPHSCISGDPGRSQRTVGWRRGRSISARIASCRNTKRLEELPSLDEPTSLQPTNQLLSRALHSIGILHAAQKNLLHVAANVQSPVGWRAGQA